MRGHEKERRATHEARMFSTFSYSEGHIDILWNKQLQPTFGQIFDGESISQVLSLESRQIDSDFPIQDVSTGAPCIIVPLKTLDILKRAKISRNRYFEFIKDTQAKTILIFCSETYKKENDLNVRFFADYYGVYVAGKVVMVAKGKLFRFANVRFLNSDL